MGCGLGAYLFDVSADVNLYSKLAEAYDDYTLRALTDDLQSVIPTPQDTDDPDAWDQTFRRAAAFVREYETLGSLHGAHLHPKKLRLLLPAHAPDPPPDLFEVGVVRRDGIVVAGTPVGTDAFIAEHANGKVATLHSKVNGIMQLAENEPQMAIRLLTLAGNNALC